MFRPKNFAPTFEALAASPPSAPRRTKFAVPSDGARLIRLPFLRRCVSRGPKIMLYTRKARSRPPMRVLPLPAKLLKYAKNRLAIVLTRGDGFGLANAILA